MSHDGALAIAAAVAVVVVVGLVLALVNRRARRWRFGIFYERDDEPPESKN